MAICLTGFWLPASAQEITVSGRVTEESGEGLPGVSIVVKGTSIGTISDLEGTYTLEVPSENAVLAYSYVGYTTEEVLVGDRTVIDIVMLPDVTALEEIVVIGYGEQKKSLTTGAISSVKAEELQTVSNGRIDQALQGRTPGVNVVPNSGSPGSGTKIRIRGASTNGNADPLFIIDGVRSGAGGMDYLSPSEIESIEVLKDAASAAIYGAEGANGVVIITTKSGEKGSSQITYNGQYGVQSVDPNLMPLMNAQQYQEYMEEAGVSGAPSEADVEGLGEGTDWFSELFQNAPQQNHSLNFSGGSDKSTFFLGGTIFQQEGVAGGEKSRFNRYTVRINSRHNLNDWLTVGENLSYAYINRRGLSEDNEYGSIVGSALSLDPLTPVVYDGNTNLPPHVQNAIAAGHPLVTDEDGNYYGISNYVRGEFGNPLARIQLNKGNTVQSKILGNVFAEVSPVLGLKFTSRLGIDAAFQRYHTWTPTFWYSSESQNPTATGSDNWDQWYTWQWENFASYERTIGVHNFSVLAGTAIQEYTYNNVNGSYSGLFREEDKWAYGDFTPDNLDRIGSRPETRSLASFFGRVSYDYNNTYLFNATVRYDGSSMLADGNQWGTFPSASVGWVIIQ